MKIEQTITVPFKVAFTLLPHSQAKAAMKEMGEAVQPFLFFWDEWTLDESCTLSKTEIVFIDQQIAEGFPFGFYHYFMPEAKLRFVRLLNKKLRSAYPVFKEFVVLKFLLQVLHLAYQYRGKAFFDTPISLLYITKPYKDAFRGFGVFCVRMIFFYENERQFAHGWFYARIVNFLVLLKTEKIIFTLNPISTHEETIVNQT